MKEYLKSDQSQLKELKKKIDERSDKLYATIEDFERRELITPNG